MRGVKGMYQPAQAVQVNPPASGDSIPVVYIFQSSLWKSTLSKRGAHFILLSIHYPSQLHLAQFFRQFSRLRSKCFQSTRRLSEHLDKVVSRMCQLEVEKIPIFFMSKLHSANLLLQTTITVHSFQARYTSHHIRSTPNTLFNSTSFHFKIREYQFPHLKPIEPRASNPASLSALNCPFRRSRGSPAFESHPEHFPCRP